MPKITVVLTSYNHANFIAQAINSVLDQTFTDFELIIWDDASTDGSWEIITAYTDERIRCFRSAHNSQILEGLNRSIEHLAAGEYIAIHHSDDMWEPDKLEKQAAFLDEHPETGAVFTRVTVIDEYGVPVADKYNYYANIFREPNRNRFAWLRHFFIQGNALCHPSVLIRKDCYRQCGVYSQGAVCLGDFDMWVRLCKKFEIFIIDEPLTRFRYFNDSSNTSANKLSFHSCARFTYYTILQHYNTITSFEKLRMIFPEVEKYDRRENTNTHFALAMHVLDMQLDKHHVLFALSILYECLNNDHVRNAIANTYGFDRMQFARLVSKNDPFIVEMDMNVNNYIDEINVLQGQSSQIKVELIAAKSELMTVYSSRSWQITKPLRTLKNFIHKYWNQ